MTSSDQGEAARGLEDIALRGCNYLEREWATTGTVERDVWTSLVSYLGPEVVFEIEIDWRDEIAFAFVGEPGPQGRPAAYSVHEGRVVRRSLVATLDLVLGPGNEPASRLRSVAKGSGPAVMREQIDAICDVFREHYPVIVAHRLELFPPA